MTRPPLTLVLTSVLAAAVDPTDRPGLLASMTAPRAGDGARPVLTAVPGRPALAAVPDLPADRPARRLSPAEAAARAAHPSMAGRRAAPLAPVIPLPRRSQEQTESAPAPA